MQTIPCTDITDGKHAPRRAIIAAEQLMAYLRNRDGLPVYGDHLADLIESREPANPAIERDEAIETLRDVRGSLERYIADYPASVHRLGGVLASVRSSLARFTR